MGILQDLTYGAAKRWIAGKDMEAALAKAKEANAKGLGTILNYLGEDVTDPKRRRVPLRGVRQAAARHRNRGNRRVRLREADPVRAGGARGFGGRGQGPAARGGGRRDGAHALARHGGLRRDDADPATSTRSFWMPTRTWASPSRPTSGEAKTTCKRLMDIGGKVRLVKGAYREPSDARLPLAPAGDRELPQAPQAYSSRGGRGSPWGPMTPGPSRRPRGSTIRAPTQSSSSRCSGGYGTTSSSS